MRERIYRTYALILRRNNLGEADRILTVATPRGKRHVIAKGVRKTTSRIAGHIELFTHVQLLLAVGRNLDVVTQSHVLDRFSTLHSDLSRLGCAYYAADLYHAFTQEGEEHPTLFHLLVTTFAALNTTRNPDLVLRAFELRLLHTAGYRPHLHQCAVCQEPLTEQAERLSPSLGGVICPHDAHADRAALPMQAQTFRLLRYLAREPYDVIERMTISSDIRTEAERLLHAFIRHLLERELKSGAFLESLRGGVYVPSAIAPEADRRGL
jgi:DNA repair protein RecO (recombination protein O)